MFIFFACPKCDDKDCELKYTLSNTYLISNYTEPSAQPAVQTKKTSVMWSSHITTKKAPVSFAVCARHTAGPHGVSAPLTWLLCAPQNCRDFKNSLRSSMQKKRKEHCGWTIYETIKLLKTLNRRRSRHTVGVCAYLKILIRHLLRCSPFKRRLKSGQMPMGK